MTIPIYRDAQYVAYLLGIESQTLATWRCSGSGPPFVKIGRLVRYKDEDLQKWLESRSFNNTAEARAAAKD
jgi:predicted DNA-binding transcriptional regulator AlpA